MNADESICVRRECDHPAICRGLCGCCWRTWWFQIELPHRIETWPRVGIMAWLAGEDPPPCAVEGCDKPYGPGWGVGGGYGLCKLHYGRAYRHFKKMGGVAEGDEGIWSAWQPIEKELIARQIQDLESLLSESNEE